jgi:zinc protease
MFKGTSKHPAGEFPRPCWIGGNENAFTSTDYTGYFQRAAQQLGDDGVRGRPRPA